MNADDILARERRIGARMHALVIGINEYERFPLRGAVADADAIHKYLRTKLDVPSHRIKNFRNAQATRNAIVQELIAMRTRRAIERNDPILIYFAGYGSSARYPPSSNGNHLEEMIPAIVPYDCVLRERSKCAPLLHDRTLAGLLAHLSKQKGDNIVGGMLIFDVIIYTHGYVQIGCDL